jgi:molybdate transport system substrate-binding protein
MRAAVAFLALLLAGCGSVPAPAATPDPVQGSLTVLAASSLTAAFNQAGADFHRLHPGVSVQFSFNGSSTLVTQITEGAPADLFASADQANMDKVTAAGLAAATPQVFAHNQLEIVVAPGNPKHITGLADLAAPGLLVVLAGPSVPAGRYALQALQSAGVTVKPVSLELDVKSVVSKVALGEADAGIVYVTDVKAAGSSVAGVPIPAQDNVDAVYPAAVLKDAANPVAARAFLDYLLGPGQATLAAFGFAGA